MCEQVRKRSDIYILFKSFLKQELSQYLRKNAGNWKVLIHQSDGSILWQKYQINLSIISKILFILVNAKKLQGFVKESHWLSLNNKMEKEDE